MVTVTVHVMKQFRFTFYKINATKIFDGEAGKCYCPEGDDE